MSTPSSLSPSPLTGLGDSSSKTLLEDDYSVGKFNLKTKAVTSAGGTINCKNTVSLKDLSRTQEFKLQFPWRNYYVWLGSRGANQQFKLHVDFGEVDLIRKQRWFGSFNYEQLKFGQVFENPKSTVHTRFSMNNRGRWTYFARGQHRDGDQQHTWVAELDSRHRLSRYDYQLGYFLKDTQFFVKHEALESPIFAFHQHDGNQYGLGKVSTSIVHNHGQHSVGAQVQLNSLNNIGFLLGASTKVNGHTVKARFNSVDKSVAVALKGKVLDKFNYAVALDSAQKPGLIPHLPVGLTLEIAL